jgi:hypothetical protein
MEGWGQVTRETDVRLRREGMADAAVLLVAKRIMPSMDLADWGRALGLNELDLQHAVTRFKNPGGVRRSPRDAQAERDAIVAALRQEGGVLRSPEGRANSLLRSLCSLPIDVFVMSNRLAELERTGLIRRKVIGKRTFTIELAA